MKCKNCGEDLFKGQFACHRCGQIVKAPKEETPKKKKVKEK